MIVDASIVQSFSEIYIPARTLPYGIYELRLTVTMIAAPQWTSTVSAFTHITPSGITANLVQFGTSLITRGHDQDLLLDPGQYSVDLDGDVFNASVSLFFSFSFSFFIGPDDHHTRAFDNSLGLDIRVFLSYLWSLQLSQSSGLASSHRRCPSGSTQSIVFDKSLKFDPEGSAAVRWSAHFASFVPHHSRRVTAGQSHLSVSSVHGESSQCFSSSHRISSCSC